MIKAGANASQYAGSSNAALPPVIIKSVEFIANSIAIMEMKDIPKAVLKASFQEKPSLLFISMVSSKMEVQSPAIIAKTICHIREVAG